MPPAKFDHFLESCLDACMNVCVCVCVYMCLCVFVCVCMCLCVKLRVLCLCVYHPIYEFSRDSDSSGAYLRGGVKVN